MAEAKATVARPIERNRLPSAMRTDSSSSTIAMSDLLSLPFPPLRVGSRSFFMRGQEVALQLL